MYPFYEKIYERVKTLISVEIPHTNSSRRDLKKKNRECRYECVPLSLTQRITVSSLFCICHSRLTITRVTRIAGEELIRLSMTERRWVNWNLSAPTLSPHGCIRCTIAIRLCARVLTSRGWKGISQLMGH